MWWLAARPCWLCRREGRSGRAAARPACPPACLAPTAPPAPRATTPCHGRACRPGAAHRQPHRDCAAGAGAPAGRQPAPAAAAAAPAGAGAPGGAHPLRREGWPAACRLAPLAPGLQQLAATCCLPCLPCLPCLLRQVAFSSERKRMTTACLPPGHEEDRWGRAGGPAGCVQASFPCTLPGPRSRARACLASSPAGAIGSAPTRHPAC